MNEQYRLRIMSPEEVGDLKITDIPEYQNSVHTLIAILVDSPTYNKDGTVNRKAFLLERGTSILRHEESIEIYRLIPTPDDIYFCQRKISVKNKP